MVPKNRAASEKKQRSEPRTAKSSQAERVAEKVPSRRQLITRRRLTATTALTAVGFWLIARYRNDPGKMFEDIDRVKHGVRQVVGPQTTEASQPSLSGRSDEATPPGGTAAVSTAPQSLPQTPTPTHTSTPTPTPSPTATPVPAPPAVTVLDAWIEENLIHVRFAVANLRNGQVPWAFVRVRGQLAWYPGERPISDGRDVYFASLHVGDAPKFTVYILVLDRDGQREVEKYLDARYRDREWARGMDRLPETAISRAEWPVTRPERQLVTPVRSAPQTDADRGAWLGVNGRGGPVPASSPPP